MVFLYILARAIMQPYELGLNTQEPLPPKVIVIMYSCVKRKAAVELSIRNKIKRNEQVPMNFVEN
jgi:hypothetical protein